MVDNLNFSETQNTLVCLFECLFTYTVKVHNKMWLEFEPIGRKKKKVQVEPKLHNLDWLVLLTDVPVIKY